MHAIITLIIIFLILFLAFIISLRLLAIYKMKKLKGATLNEFKNEKRLILYFYSENCGACKVMAPIIDSIKEVKVKKIDVFSKEGAKLVQELGIMGTPTTVLIEKGNVLNAFIGVKKKEDILNMFTKPQ
ncbi:MULTISPECIES: thioredoxin family protein [unclassified Hydrogenobaculum]|jgi:Thioredoxin domain-containing protein|uniref:thioredoxin family protein n=1 Tax=unclassified Hydrogenobaculum TaxID=2622382 RepID=UPI0001C51333|nr:MULTISPECIES: thioredoxin family protein [unclassified Hydrogenobaculum]AEF19631.1 Thioredoxin domain-containing protein [Hydrogenobaculum sp. 3684]AEG46919.1 Thioredoxin domain-containing protein [Hydrogenobaculum sp. SHO]AGG15566.1 Thioredoxin domain-containing protein [Hydrogenobaculum sp. HO]AGH93865.1 thioredoxin domain-containing protein [Hydrogenobaculum sp. SN]